MNPPFGLSLICVTGEQTPAHVAARRFCLDTIKEFYGFDYDPRWHLDIDTLLLSAAENHYSEANRGAFWTLVEPGGDIVATCGVRALTRRPDLLRALHERYPNPDQVASLWRLYVRQDQRRRGLGKWLSRVAEDAAVRLGYATMYLHASTDAVSTMEFWKAAGYKAFGELDFSTHFDKMLAATVRA